MGNLGGVESEKRRVGSREGSDGEERGKRGGRGVSWLKTTAQRWDGSMERGGASLRHNWGEYTRENHEITSSQTGK